MANRAYKFRIYPNNEQMILLPGLSAVSEWCTTIGLIEGSGSIRRTRQI